MDERLNAIVGAKITEFKRKMATVRATMATMPQKMVIDVDVRVRKFQRKMDRLATTIRTFSQIGGNMVGGGLLAMSPSLAPILASTAAALGGLGPMIGVLSGGLAGLGPMLGTMGGGLLGLASAFTAAGIGAVGFGAVAVPNIADIFKTQEELNAAREAVAGAETEEERAEAMKVLNGIQSKLNGTQKDTLTSMQKFGSFWSGFQKDFQKPVLEVFSKSMGTLETVLTKMKPTLKLVADAVSVLFDSFNEALKTDQVQEIFNWLGRNGASSLMNVTKAAGYLIKGFLNMMVAFEPLAKAMETGFLNMAKNFSDWAAGLSKSKKFEAFMEYVTTNMPKLRAIFRDALAGIAYFFAAFGPLSSEMMTGLAGMMERFKEWSKTLGQNQEFQSFIDYVRTNGPKLLTIFNNILDGIVGMFTAFAPMSADMMTGLQDLTERFKNWGETLSKNQQFQSFIDYVKTNGPGVISLIGNLVTFLVNLGIGMAPLGSKIVEIVSGFLSWMNSMMAANPWFGKVVAWVVTIAGILRMVIPIIVAFSTIFGGAAKAIWVATAMMRAKFVLGMTMMIKSMAKAVFSMIITTAKFIAKWALIGAKSLFHAARVAAAWFIALGPIGWVIAIVIGLVALIILNWKSIKKWTVKIWSAVWTWIKNIWSKVWGKTKEVASNIYNTVRDKFNAMKNAVGEKMTAAKDKITSIWDRVTGFFSSINLYQTGKDIIQGLISGISNMFGKIKGIVKRAANLVPTWLKKKLGVASPSKVTTKIGQFTGDGIVNGMGDRMKAISKKAKDIALAATPKMNNVDVAMSVVGGVNPAINNSDMRSIQHGFSAEVNDFEMPEREDIILEISGKEVGRATYKDVSENIERDRFRARRRPK